MAGKFLNRSVRSKLQPSDSSFFPFGRAAHTPRRLHRRATGRWLHIFAVSVYLRLLDRAAKLLENCTTIKAFSQMWEGVERTARRMKGNTTNCICRKMQPTKHLLLEENVDAVKRMRCSCRSGVTLYSYENGHFMAYTSSERLKPPTFPSEGKAFGGIANTVIWSRRLPIARLYPFFNPLHPPAHSPRHRIPRRQSGTARGTGR